MPAHLAINLGPGPSVLSPQNAVHSVNHRRLPSLARASRLADPGAGGVAHSDTKRQLP